MCVTLTVDSNANKITWWHYLNNNILFCELVANCLQKSNQYRLSAILFI